LFCNGFIYGRLKRNAKTINDDLNRENLTRDNLRRDELDRRESGMSSGWMMLIAAVAVFAVLFMWAPWNGPRVADNTAPGTTTGSSTTRPSAPMAPNTAPAPTGPAAPTTTR
jgi:hypothetical protein